MHTIKKAADVILVCDGALRSTSLGAIAVLHDPASGATFAISIALSVFGAMPTDAEWVGKILGFR